MTSSTEDPEKCAISNTIDDYSTNKVRTGEVCTIETAKQYGIFGKNEYFNGLIPKAEKVNVLADNKEGAGFALCSVSGNIAYQNCALSTNNPWKVLNKSREYCMLPLDVTLPDALKVNDTTKTIEKPMSIPCFKSLKDFCQERWYDWFSIPDYHFGNGYSIVEISSNESKCIKPCEIGLMPYKEDGATDRCILRDKYEYGFYASSFHYLPVSLILLLGSTKETLLKKHESVMSFTRSSNLENISVDFDLFNNIINDEETKNNIYDGIKTDLRYNIKQLFKVPFNETNIVPPYGSVQRISNKMMRRDRIIDAYEIAENLERMISSNDPETMKEYVEWKKSLADISGFGINDTKFYKQILILKRACNVAFDRTTQYSRDVILYTLNKDLDDKNDKPYKPIKCELTDNDIILSMRPDTDDDMNSSNLSKKQEDLIADENTQETLLDKDDQVDLNINKTDADMFETDELIKPRDDKKDSKSMARITKMIVCTVLFLIVLFYILAVIFLLMYLFWTPVAMLLNEVVMGFIYFLYVVADLFRGRYTPSTVNSNILQLQRKFIDGKIFHDRSKYLT